MEKRLTNDEIKPEVVGADPWDLMDRILNIMGPLLLLCRLADGQKPVMSKFYGTTLCVRQKIQDVADEADDDSVERRICDVVLEKLPKM